MANIDNFRAGFDGVRANRYKIVTGALSGLNSSSSGMSNSELYVKAVSMPGSNIGMIPVSFQGRQIKFSGERQFNEWSFTCYDSASAGVRSKFESWINLLDDKLTHRVSYNEAEMWDVFYNDAADQGHPGNSAGAGKGFRLHHVWPVDISPIDLSYDMVDSFAEFTVTIAYDWHEALGGI